jgi:hypothetical protein
VHLAGRLLTAADWGYAKPRELLCLFASSPPLAREQIGLALWPELAEGQLRNGPSSRDASPMAPGSPPPTSGSPGPGPDLDRGTG